MDLIPGTAVIYIHGTDGCFLSMKLFHRNNETLDAICPIDIAPVPVGLLLKIFMFFNKNIPVDELADILNRRKIGGGKY
jgi:hypothetical protein